MNAKVLSFEGHGIERELRAVKESPRRHISFLDEWVPRHARMPVEGRNVSATYNAMAGCFELHISAENAEDVQKIIDLLKKMD